jgi:Ca2+-binding EF-hand superfamily protein
LDWQARLACTLLPQHQLRSPRSIPIRTAPSIWPRQAAGAKVFAKLDPDKDGTLDAKELGDRVDAAALKAADPDGDGTLDAKEYAGLIETRFKAADPDKDGTLDEKELGTDAGKSLLKLIE